MHADLVLLADQVSSSTCLIIVLLGRVVLCGFWVEQAQHQLEELQQHLAVALEERDQAQAALQHLSEQVTSGSSPEEHLQSATQVDGAEAGNAELAEDLAAAQEQIQALTEQLEGAIREIQDRQGELRRINDQAAGLADELAQCQHQAQLDAEHAAQLQSEAITSKIHLLEEVQRLTQESAASQADMARLQAALAEAEGARADAAKGQAEGAQLRAALQEAQRAAMDSQELTRQLQAQRAQEAEETTLQQAVALQHAQKAAGASSAGPLQRLAESLFQEAEVRGQQEQQEPRRLNSWSWDGATPQAAHQELAIRLPSLAPHYSSNISQSRVWGDDFLCSACESSALTFSVWQALLLQPCIVQLEKDTFACTCLAHVLSNRMAGTASHAGNCAHLCICAECSMIAGC